MYKVLLISFLLFFELQAMTQNVGIGTSTPAASAQLDISSTTKGLLPPRMTQAQRNAIVSPAAGLMVWCTDCSAGGELNLYNGTAWINYKLTSIAPFPNILICGQIWAGKNLDVSTYRNGDPIPQVTDPAAWAALTTGAWCYYNNDPSNNAIYGKLYNWYAVNDPRGLAPAGWHIPSDAEWTTLSNCLGGDGVAGGAMKETGTTLWLSPNTGATNSSAWAGRPGSFRYDNGGFDVVSGCPTCMAYGYWWSSTENPPNNADYRVLSFNNIFIWSGLVDKRYGYSVRCLRD